MHPFRKSFDNSDRGMTINGHGDQSMIINSMSPPRDQNSLPSGVRKLNNRKTKTGEKEIRFEPPVDKLSSAMDAASEAMIEMIENRCMASERFGFGRVFVDVQIAEFFKSTALPNRHVTDRFIEKKMKAIRDDRWVDNDQGISFDREGHLINGNQRIEAIIRTGKGIWLTVFVGLTTEARGVIDSQEGIHVRRLADQLDMFYGINKNKSRAAAMLRLLYELATDKNCNEERADILYPMIWEPNQEAVDWANANFPSKKKDRDNSVVVAAFAFAYPTDPERVKKFAEMYKSQNGWYDDAPAKTFSIVAVDGKKKLEMRHHRFDLASSLLIVMQAYLDGESKITKKNVTNAPRKAKNALKFFRKSFKIARS